MTNGLVDKPAPLNRAPDGLLGFLGIKNGGKNPQFLAPYCQPVFDLYDHYLNTAPEYVFVSAALSSGDNIQLLAEAGEVLYVTSFSVSASPGVGEAVSYQLGRGMQNAGSVSLTSTLVLGASTFQGIAFTDPLWLMPNEWVGTRVLSVTGVVDGFFSARFVRLQM